MANTRIRYRSIGDGILASRRVFTVALDGVDTDVVVILDTDLMRFKIVTVVDDVDSDSMEILRGGNTKNISVLKIQAKKGLRELGYEFGTETRARGVASNVGDSGASEALSTASVNGR